MPSRYVVTYAVFAVLIGFVDVAGANTLVDTFAFKTLCGPILAWIMALFLPAESIMKAVDPARSVGEGDNN